MLSIRTRIFIIFSIIILIILGIALALLIGWQERGKESAQEQIELPPTDISQPIVKQNLATEIPKGMEVKPLTTEEMEKNAAKQTAKIFIERIASYSTDNAYQNIRDVETLSTNDLWNILEKRIETLSGDMEFVGVTSKAFNTVLSNWGSQSAEISVTVLETKKQNGEVVSEYKEYKINTVKVGDNWLVDDYKLGETQ